MKTFLPILAVLLVVVQSSRADLQIIVRCWGVSADSMQGDIPKSDFTAMYHDAPVSPNEGSAAHLGFFDATGSPQTGYWTFTTFHPAAQDYWFGASVINNLFDRVTIHSGDTVTNVTANLGNSWGANDTIFINIQGHHPIKYGTQTVTLNNAATSGMQQYACFYFNGLLTDSILLCPGNSATESHQVSLFDPVDSFTGGLVPFRPSTTNVVGTVVNDLKDKMVLAFWKNNNVIVKQEYLSPGQSDTYNYNLDLCTPNLNVSWGYTVAGTVPDPANAANPFGNLTNSLGQFNTGTNGIGAGAAGSGVSGGGGSGSFAGDYVFTNNINFPVGLSNLTGLALDSTLRAGLGQLHEDNLNAVKGQNVLHQDNSDLLGAVGLLARTNPIIFNAPSNVSVMNFPSNSALDYTPLLATNNAILNKFYGETTNADGQRVAYEGVVSNDLWMIVKWLTNSSPTNIVQVQFPTNNYSISLSNYATESTLAGISNLLATTSTLTMNTNPGDGGFGAMLDSNTPTGLNLEVTNNLAQGGSTNFNDLVTASASASTEFSAHETSGIMALIAEMTPIDIDENFGDPDMTYTFNLGGYARTGAAKMRGTSGTTLDFNPMHNDAIAPLFGFSKTLWIWGLALIYMRQCVRDSFKALELCNQTHGVTATAPIIKK